MNNALRQAQGKSYESFVIKYAIPKITTPDMQPTIKLVWQITFIEIDPA